MLINVKFKDIKRKLKSHVKQEYDIARVRNVQNEKR